MRARQLTTKRAVHLRYVDGGGRTIGVDTGGLDGARVGDKRERPNAADLENTNTEASVHEAQVQDELSGGASVLCAAQ